MNKLAISSLLLSSLLIGCNQDGGNADSTKKEVVKSAKENKSDDASLTNLETNPFFSEYDTPFGIPPFDKIKNEHYAPAFEKAIA
ncbi:MAG: peptidase M3, partial [Kangiellaceae bacterium]